jgi:hypothetical protein
VEAVTREEALAKAAAHIEKLATNARGYQDGVSFAGKVAATVQLAEFLLGEGDDDGA